MAHQTKTRLIFTMHIFHRASTVSVFPAAPLPFRNEESGTTPDARLGVVFQRIAFVRYSAYRISFNQTKSGRHDPGHRCIVQGHFLNTRNTMRILGGLNPCFVDQELNVSFFAGASHAVKVSVVSSLAPLALRF